MFLHTRASGGAASNINSLIYDGTFIDESRNKINIENSPATSIHFCRYLYIHCTLAEYQWENKLSYCQNIGAKFCTTATIAARRLSYHRRVILKRSRGV